jgi:hypothetical protein
MSINLTELKAKIDRLSPAQRLRLAADILEARQGDELAECIASIVVHELQVGRQVPQTSTLHRAIGG